MGISLTGRGRLRQPVNFSGIFCNLLASAGFAGLVVAHYENSSELDGGLGRDVEPRGLR